MKKEEWPLVLPAFLFGLLGGFIGSFIVFGLNKIPEDVIARGHPLISAPFLTFLLVAVLGSIFYRPIHSLLSKGQLTIKWGDKEISLSEIEKNVDTQFHEYESKLADVDAEVRDLKRLVLSSGTAATAEKDLAHPDESTLIKKIKHEFGWVQSDDMARLVYHLGSSQFGWRNLDTLCDKIGLHSRIVDDLALSVPEHIIRGKGKTGGVIYRLSAQAKGRLLQIVRDAL